MKSTCLVLTIVLTACATNEHAVTEDVQMQDLSVLFPLPRSQADLDAMLSPTSAGSGGPLLPPSVLQDGQLGIDTELLQVVGFRVDPCFGQTDPAADPSKCENQLRLVFQPISLASNGGLAEDAAVHAFYSLERAQLLALVGELIAARKTDAGDADLGPLAPEPVIAREGLTGALAQRYTQILTKYAGSGNLVQLTSLVFLAPLAGGAPPTTGFPQDWELQGFTVANGETTPLTIPTLPQDATALSIDTSTMPLTFDAQPATTSPDTMALLANFAQAQAATAAVRQAAFDAALRIENPRFHDPNTIDCASCHMAQPARELVGDALGMTEAGNANRFTPDASIPVSDLAATTQLIDSDGGLNIHAFAYRDAEPMINQRVINETAANVAYVAELLQ